MPKIIVRIPERSDRRWKAWRKVLTGVDTAKANGYAFEGDWLPLGRKIEIDAGALILLYDETGTDRSVHNRAESRLVR